MKNIAVVFGRNTEFHTLFPKESPFVKGIRYWTNMLKDELENKGYRLISYLDMKDAEDVEAFFHFDRLRKDILKQYSGKYHIYLGFEPAVVEPAHAPKVMSLLARYVYDAVLTLHTDISGERIYPVRLPADICFIREDGRQPEKLACLFSGDKTGFGKELYSLRRKTIRYAEKNFINEFAFFENWGRPYSAFRCYQGYTDDKRKAAEPYKFCFCFENEYGMRGGYQKKFLRLCV